VEKLAEDAARDVALAGNVEDRRFSAA